VRACSQCVSLCFKSSSHYNKPVFSSDVRLSWDTTSVDDDTKDHESDTSDDLHQTESVFDLCISAHTKELDDDESDQQWNNESSGVDTLRSWPIMDDVDSSGNFVREDSQPTDGVFPSAGETERGVDEANNVHAESSVDGIKDGHFCESLHHEVSG